MMSRCRQETEKEQSVRHSSKSGSVRMREDMISYESLLPEEDDDIAYHADMAQQRRPTESESQTGTYRRPIIVADFDDDEQYQTHFDKLLEISLYSPDEKAGKSRVKSYEFDYISRLSLYYGLDDDDEEYIVEDRYDLEKMSG